VFVKVKNHCFNVRMQGTDVSLSVMEYSEKLTFIILAMCVLR